MATPHISQHRAMVAFTWTNSHNVYQSLQWNTLNLTPFNLRLKNEASVQLSAHPPFPPYPYFEEGTSISNFTSLH